MDKIINNDTKKALTYMAILDLIEKANVQKWAEESDKGVEVCRELIELQKDLGVELGG